MNSIVLGIILVLGLLELNVWRYRHKADKRNWRDDDGSSQYNGSNWTGGSSSDSWLDFITGGDGGFFDGGHCSGDGGGHGGGDCGGGDGGGH